MYNDELVDNPGSGGESVDGYSDSPDGTVDAPDRGVESDLEPLSPEEYAKLQKEARQEDDK